MEKELGEVNASLLRQLKNTDNDKNAL